MGGALVVAGQGKDNAALRSIPSTSAVATTLPEATTAPAVADTSLGPAEPPSTGPDAGPTTAQVVSTTTAQTPLAPSGELVTTFATVGLKTVDRNTGSLGGELPLRNSGPGPLTYSTRSSFAGLSVDKPTGTIGPGDTVVLAITVDGTKTGEGPFTGTLSFGGSGGTKEVAVGGTVGRPPVIKEDAGESCSSGLDQCSRVIQLVPVSTPAPSPTLCNTPWRYSVTVEDESQLKAVQVDANLAGRSAALKKEGATRGTASRWQSDVFPPLPVAARLNVTIKAVDEFDFFSVRTKAGVTC